MKKIVSVSLAVVVIIMLQGCDVLNYKDKYNDIKNELERVNNLNIELEMDNKNLSLRVEELEKQINQKKSNLRGMFN